MIGYYVHHQGLGHLHRARALVSVLDEPVTGLSTLPRPDDWTGDWVRLPADDVDGASQVAAGGQLHWAPRRSSGVLERAARISSWLASARPRLVVVDVSAETTMLVRLHGVPVVGIVLPGRRDDRVHLAAYRMSELLVAAWPADVGGLTPGLPADVAERVHCIGAVSRFAPVSQRVFDQTTRRVLVLHGRGSKAAATTSDITRLQSRTPGWQWTSIGGPGSWVEDPSPLLRVADVVVTHAGQGALADVAAHRLPAIVVPEARPFAEQVTTGAALAAVGLPAVVDAGPGEEAWSDLLACAALLDGRDWDRWYDGLAPARFASLVAER